MNNGNRARHIASMVGLLVLIVSILAACVPIQPKSEGTMAFPHVETVEEEVRRASEQFVAALNDVVNGDARSMEDIWSHGADVTTMHGIGGREVGWTAVQTSWEGVAQIASDGQIILEDQVIHTNGDLAYELGVEHLTLTLAGHPIDTRVRVTRIYRREDELWKAVHHHVDTDESIQEVLKRLQAGS